MHARIMAGCVSLALSMPAAAENLVELYQRARQYDAEFAAAQAANRAAQERLPQARSRFLPNVNLNATTHYNNNDITFSGSTIAPSGTRRYNSRGYNIGLVQPLFNRENNAVLGRAQAEIDEADARLEVAEQDLILRVAQAYFDVLLAQDSVNYVAAQKAAVGEQLAQAKRNFEVGTATITDTHEAQARYDMITAQEIAAANDLEVRRRALERLTGARAVNPTPLRANIPLDPPQPTAVEHWIQRATDQSPELKAQRALAEAARSDIERARSAKFPIVDAVANHGDQRAGGGTFGGSDTRATSVGVQLNYQIFEGGARDSRVREAIANQERAQQAYADAERRVELAARQAYLGVTSGVAQVRALEQALTSSQASMDSTRLGFEVGVRTSVDVLNAQQQLTSARRELAQARYNYLLSRLRLEAAAGTLDENDLRDVSAGMDDGAAAEPAVTTPLSKR